jgi:hypothetical protein
VASLPDVWPDNPPVLLPDIRLLSARSLLVQCKMGTCPFPCLSGEKNRGTSAAAHKT